MPRKEIVFSSAVQNLHSVEIDKPGTGFHRRANFVDLWSELLDEKHTPLHAQTMWVQLTSQTDARPLMKTPAVSYELPEQKACDCTYICSAPALSAALTLNVALVDGDELRAVGENGALPRTKLLDNPCPEMFELTGKFNA